VIVVVKVIVIVVVVVLMMMTTFFGILYPFQIHNITENCNKYVISASIIKMNRIV